MAAESYTAAVLLPTGVLRDRCRQLLRIDAQITVVDAPPCDLLITHAAKLGKCAPGPAAVLSIDEHDRADGLLPEQFTDREFQLALQLLKRVRRLKQHQSSRGSREAALAELALTDPLTGLPNRRAWESQPPAAAPGAVLYFDVDWLKQVNDNLGHDAGDRALAAIGSALRHALREDDFPARIGGDEFVVRLYDVDLATAQSIAQRVRQAASAAATAAVGNPVTLSVGVAPGSDEESLRRADAALRQAKRQRRETGDPG